MINRKYIYYIVFGITFLLFNIVQEFFRPNYNGENRLINYILGVLPNFLPGIGLCSLFYVIIPEVFKPNIFIFKKRLKWSVIISMSGLVLNEVIIIFTSSIGVFDWNDILWTFIGGGLFLIIHRKIIEVV